MSETNACSSCNHAENCTSTEACSGKNSMLAALNGESSIKKVIGIVSGKGGVGKSFVTASLANLTRKKGYQVGILDADITGPSIPKMYGIKGPAYSDGTNMIPPTTENGLEIMSVNLLLDDEQAPVLWRGPVIAGMVKQFWTDVKWGELDYLFVDMPPGTGDVPLTVFQSLPLDGIVIVTSPQDLVQLIVKKAYNMAKMMNIPVLGLVENYSYVKCPDCGKELRIFGESHVDEVADEIGTKVLAKLPIISEYAAQADAGQFFQVEHADLEWAAEEIISKK